MAMRILCFLISCVGLLLTSGIHADDGSPKENVAATLAAAEECSVGETLYLTPLIEAGTLDEAKLLSKVGRIGADNEVPSYAGYITVNPQFNSNLFFWFVPAMTNPENAPVVLWLQGGPGSSSLLGFFVEHGPYRLSKDGKDVKFRKRTWARRYSMLYVDQPVGSGYSFTDSKRGYARDMTDVGRDMLEFLQQFFTLFGELGQNEFYITGESYAGKYVPTVGAVLHQNADTMRVKINFRGIAIGNGFTDPVNMLGFGELLYSFGLIDRISADYMTRVANQAADCIRGGLMRDAVVLMDRLFFGVIHKNTFYENVTGMHYYYNLLYDTAPNDNVAFKTFVQRPELRRALHVGHQTFHMSHSVVATSLFDDLLRSARPQFTVVVEGGYKVLVYNGNLDMAMATTQTENFLSQVAWSHADRWNREPRTVWRSGDGRSLYGYKKTVENLSFVVVRNGGHLLPFDQPRASYELITAFIDNKRPFEA
ncbi:venom serine carboxypeptidase [Dermacentor silvarum]|uniref:venom serine carboxypeptidase n=1 Tax=Dermacentor silvarum TaxID=543639 RepID=UPI00189BF14D|nr:venom serine carboxypeptidase [Dermacentor silvarum]